MFIVTTRDWNPLGLGAGSKRVWVWVPKPVLPCRVRVQSGFGFQWVLGGSWRGLGWVLAWSWVGLGLVLDSVLATPESPTIWKSPKVQSLSVSLCCC